MFKINVFKRSYQLFFCLILLLGVGCKSRTVLEPVHRSSQSLSREVVEKLALQDEWGQLRNYLMDLNGSQLKPENKPYALYWLGTAHHFSGREDGARNYWEKALKQNPSSKMRSKILKYLHLNSGFELASFDNGSAGKWLLQLGVFKMKRSANMFLEKMSWKQYSVKLNQLKLNGQMLWVVWLGPYNSNQVQRMKEQLKKERVDSLVKSTSIFL